MENPESTVKKNAVLIAAEEVGDDIAVIDGILESRDEQSPLLQGFERTRTNSWSENDVPRVRKPSVSDTTWMS